VLETFSECSKQLRLSSRHRLRSISRQQLVAQSGRFCVRVKADVRAAAQRSPSPANGKQGTELADLIVHKITEAVNAIAFK
jgi:hypothetical protein